LATTQTLAQELCATQIVAPPGPHGTLRRPGLRPGRQLRQMHHLAQHRKPRLHCSKPPSRSPESRGRLALHIISDHLPQFKVQPFSRVSPFCAAASARVCQSLGHFCAFINWSALDHLVLVAVAIKQSVSPTSHQQAPPPRTHAAAQTPAVHPRRTRAPRTQKQPEHTRPPMHPAGPREQGFLHMAAVRVRLWQQDRGQCTWNWIGRFSS